MSTLDEVRGLVAPFCEAHALELVDLEHGPGLVRVTLDKEGGIDLEAITRASEAISDLLDLHDPIPGRYTLEVTSPGLERPLRTPEQFQRFVGTVVNIKTHANVEGERRMQGELTEADEHGITVEGRRLSYVDIERARTVFEWGPTPKRKPPKREKKKASTP